MDNVVAIVGTDTGIGKTVVTSLIQKYLYMESINVITQKWIQSGDLNKPDIEIHDSLIDNRNLEKLKEYRQVYSFKHACSPHLASQIQGVDIKFSKIKKSLDFLKRTFDYVCIEGSGGLCVPINKDRLIIDYIKQLSIPVILVIGNRLGGINHALLSIDMLQKHSIPILGTVINHPKKDKEEYILRDNIKTIEHFSKIPILSKLDYNTDMESLIKEIQHLGKTLIQLIKNKK